MDDYPLLNLFWTMLVFFVWILWFMLLFRVIADLFRDDKVSGWGKTGWMLVLLFLPFLGVLVYLIARGQGMGERELARARHDDAAVRAYVRDAAQAPATTDELARLAELKNRGDITDEEYERAKAKVLS